MSGKVVIPCCGDCGKMYGIKTGLPRCNCHKKDQIKVFLDKRGPGNIKKQSGDGSDNENGDWYPDTRMHEI